MRLVVGMVAMVVTATPVVTRLFATSHLIFAQLLQTLLGAIALIGGPLLQHLIDHLIVAIETLGLIIRTLIPIQIQPVHPIHDGVDGFLGGTLQIGIFNAQNKLPWL